MERNSQPEETESQKSDNPRRRVAAFISIIYFLDVLKFVIGVVAALDPSRLLAVIR